MFSSLHLLPPSALNKLQRTTERNNDGKCTNQASKTDVNAALDNSLTIRGPSKALLFHIVT